MSWCPDHDALPSVFIHITNEAAGGLDCDAHMTWQEAKALHETLGEALGIVSALYKSGCPIDPTGANAGPK